MVVFAGPVFTEWYWGPIFFVLLYGPALAATAFGADFAVRRWLRPLSWPERGALWVGVVVGGTLLILLGRVVIAEVRFHHEATTAAQSLDFTPLQPSPLPAPFEAQMAQADQGRQRPVLYSRYGAAPGAYVSVTQQRPSVETSLRPGRCLVNGLESGSSTAYDAPCRELRTPGGRSVFIGPPKTLIAGAEAFALLDGTLVHLISWRVDDRDVLAYVDSLQQVRLDDLEFKRG